MNRYSKQDRATIIQMWNSGVPSKQIEEALGISYSVAILIGYWSETMKVTILSQDERRAAVAAWKAAAKDAQEEGQTTVDLWETVYAELRGKSGNRAIPAIGESTIQIVVSVLVDGEEVSRETTTVLKPGMSR